MREPTYAADDLPEPECSWPVIVEERKEHVVWVEGTSATNALENLKRDGSWYERISMETLASAWPEFRLPEKWDRHMVEESSYEGHYAGTEANAHVETHRYHLEFQRRQHEKAACVAAGHPKLEPVRSYTTDRFCPTCGWLKPEQVATDITQGEGKVGAPHGDAGAPTAPPYAADDRPLPRLVHPAPITDPALRGDA